jgi:pimeloyl-ACP methyl ester carboxylesterase
VLVVDRPGHGLADPFDYKGVDLLEHAQTFLRDILDALDLPTVDIAANSIGGLVAVAFALETPERVSRLVLVGAPVGVARDAPLLLRVMSLPLLGTAFGRLMMRNPTRDASRKFWGLVQVAHPERLEDALLDVDVAHTRRNLDSILSLIRCVGRGIRGGQYVLGDRWRTLKVPTLFLGGERDIFVRPKFENALRAIAQSNPNVRLLRIPEPGTCRGSTSRSESSPRSSASWPHSHEAEWRQLRPRSTSRVARRTRQRRPTSTVPRWRADEARKGRRAASSAAADFASAIRAKEQPRPREWLPTRVERSCVRGTIRWVPARNASWTRARDTRHVRRSGGDGC